jgi:tetratricopeptide (TPR) repeat protein
MKRIIALLFLAAGLTAAAQNATLDNSARYEHFKELRDQADTLGMQQMLDAWGAKDAEYYAAWSNYCSTMAEETEDPTWLRMAVNWITMGRDEYPDDLLLLLKLPQVLFDDNQFEEALPILLDIDGKGLADSGIWEYLAEIYLMKSDLDTSRKYLEKIVAETEDEEERMYAQMNLDTYDQVEHDADSLRLRLDHTAIKELAQSDDFQKLVSRFEVCDTTLTREEIASVYYGSAYGKDYNGVSRTSDDIRNLAAEGKDQEATEALQAKLKEYPVSLFLILSLFNLTEDQAVAESCAWKANALLATIDCSGKGTRESPHQVICVNDEYGTLDHLFKMTDFRGQTLVETTTLSPQDQMTFLNDFGVERTVYFYLAPPYWERLSALSE